MGTLRPQIHWMMTMWYVEKQPPILLFVELDFYL